MSNFTDVLQPNAEEFGFHRRPFSGTEAEFFPNTGYLDAYVRLLDGICQHRGLLVLTGEAGTGKTLLLRKLIQEAPATIKLVFCYSTNLDFDNLLTVICDQLQLITHEREPPSELKALKEYLSTCFEQGINVALLIDEAHHLSQDVLSHLLTLTRLGLKKGHILQIVLSGAPVLEEILVQQPALHPNIANAVHVCLEPLSEADVTAFIYRQLQSAGGPPPENLFPAPVIDGIVRYTGGILRLINMLCERALWLAQLNGQSTVSTAIIDAAASELMLQERATVQEPKSRLAHLETPRSGNTQPVFKAARPQAVPNAVARDDPIGMDQPTVLITPAAVPAVPQTDTGLPWEPEILRQTEEQLALYMGPLAKILVKKAARQATDIKDLYQILARSISTESEKTLFLQRGNRLQENSDWIRIAAAAAPQQQNLFNPQGMEAITRELTMQVGPIAKILVKKAASQAHSMEDLYQRLAMHIPNTQPVFKAARLQAHDEKPIEEATFTRQTLITRTAERLPMVTPLEQPNPRRGRFSTLLQVLLIGLLAGLIGGAGGVYLLYRQQDAPRKPGTQEFSTALPESVPSRVKGAP